MATSPLPLTLEDLQQLARLNGLDIAPARQAAVLDDLNTQLANVRLIDTLLTAATPVATQPYDPAFPPVRVDDEVSR